MRPTVSWWHNTRYRLGMANYYIFLSNEADILREMRAFIQALK